MGKEAQVRAAFADGTDEGRLQLEPPRLVFRGAQRRVWQGAALAGVRADQGDLVLADGARFSLGERQAIAWAEAILRPKGRVEKIGVKAGMRAAILGVDDPDLAAELAAAGAILTHERRDLDLLFYAADSTDQLSRLGEILPALAERGALWIASRKGKAATVRDLDVMAAAKACGLVDNKVVGFSVTHTALRLVRRRT
ncbi:DUF3052 family protein [Phenylobacterium sp.]|jgi:hypothetical protein|uniref:DUF3052 family protein n=1 Tax=Phenylobacterium sp. TaxID=1871053 RepID=UPI002F92466B